MHQPFPAPHNFTTTHRLTAVNTNVGYLALLLLAYIAAAAHRMHAARRGMCASTRAVYWMSMSLSATMMLLRTTGEEERPSSCRKQHAQQVVSATVCAYECATAAQLRCRTASTAAPCGYARVEHQKRNQLSSSPVPAPAHPH
jgi:hypothetical protein